ncbi:LEA14-like dessication related protein [Pseudomonas pohangensis]|jgi:LEA14-like dessication related protein|uniref:LEA14-like dessication related protein n=1 Tax=Pseudomonas pohangensis TaxID=364197 RepID=A0A1H2EAC7_9PSED|nr:LEA type 2 family protein [Pseudomonas pohangensis]SDT91658.1 LEA14-like dessication related protein [Pseudomonas pohangensis]
MSSSSISLRYLTGLCLVLLLAGCSSLSSRDPLNIDVAGIEPLPGQGMEMRFNLTLRVQNPNDSAIDYDGIALEMEINDQPLATGVSDQKGQVPRFGESLIKVPLTISAYSILRQAMGASTLQPGQEIGYELRGKLGGGLFAERFTASGKLDWPQPARP